MESDRYLDILAPDDVRVRGTRVGIEHLLTEYLSGRLPEEIAAEFPTVSLEEVHGVLAWYLRNRDEVDEYLRRWRSRTRLARREQAKSESPEVVQRLRRLAEQRVAR
jgi:uncharacterized protein (DUF433 family)